MASRLFREQNVHPAIKRGYRSFTPAVLELIEDDCADDDGTFNDLLPVSRHVQQVEDVVQNADDERPDNGSCNGPDAAGRKGGAPDHGRRDGVKLITDAEPRLSRTDP